MRTRFYALLVSGLLTTYSAHPDELRQRSVRQAETAPARIVVPQGWTLFAGSDGLMLQHPLGWSVQQRGGGAFAAFHPGRGDVATAVTFVLPLKDSATSALLVLQGLGAMAPDLFPALQVTPRDLPAARPETALATLRFNVQGLAFRGAALCIRQQHSGMLYVMAAQEQAWQSEAPVMTRMLTSFFYSALPEMVTWREPNEGAFTLPVPKGWSVQGGIRRFHALDLRAEVVVASPDGKTVIRLGDVSVPPMQVPDQFVQAQGLREGGWYDAGAGLQVLLRHYLPAPEFLLDYVRSQVGPAINVRYYDYPDISRQAEQNLTQATLGMVRPHIDTSEITFDAPTQNGPRKGYAVAQTQLMPIESILASDMGMWLVTFLAGYVSAPEREPIAVAVLREMLAGQAVDPAWYANELRVQGQVSAIIHRTNSEINDMAWESYQAKSASQDRMAERRSEAILGLTVVHDPSTNKQYRVTAGSNYYWLSGPDQVIGTETADPSLLPNPLLQQLQVVQ